MKNFATFLLLLVAAAVCLPQWTKAEETPVDNAVEVQMSPKCAAVLITAGTALGAGAAYAFTPAAICSVGFCPAGVTGGSFAAWWQSTMPLVASGTLFSQLQALAMGGVGMGSITVAGGALGGAAGVAYLRDFCVFVDETDPDSMMGIAFGGSLTAVTTAIKTKERLTTECASSETCTAATEKGAALAKAAVTTAIETKERIASECASSEACTAAKEVGAALAKAAVTTVIETKECIASEFASSEACTAAKEAGAVTAKYVSSLWSSFVEGVKENFEHKA